MGARDLALIGILAVWAFVATLSHYQDVGTIPSTMHKKASESTLWKWARQRGLRTPDRADEESTATLLRQIEQLEKEYADGNHRVPNAASGNSNGLAPVAQPAPGQPSQPAPQASIAFPVFVYISDELAMTFY